ncbi:MAG: hypothetical protein MUO99_01110, partial [Dehalococcoidales bacterium]|nr:hypothetical protein [Dehalococcoidales bacterium]
QLLKRITDFANLENSDSLIREKYFGDKKEGKYLKGDTSRVEMYDLRTEVTKGVTKEEEETWEEQPRAKMPRLPVPERRHSFVEIEQGFSEEQARQEAKRCLRCDLET